MSLNKVLLLIKSKPEKKITLIEFETTWIRGFSTKCKLQDLLCFKENIMQKSNWMETLMCFFFVRVTRITDKGFTAKRRLWGSRGAGKKKNQLCNRPNCLCYLLMTMLVKQRREQGSDLSTTMISECKILQLVSLMGVWVNRTRKSRILIQN